MDGDGFATALWVVRKHSVCESSIVVDVNLITAFIQVVVDKQTGISRGYGFISYDNCDSAERAVRSSVIGF